jgi:hypothetical protein
MNTICKQGAFRDAVRTIVHPLFLHCAASHLRPAQPSRSLKHSPGLCRGGELERSPGRNVLIRTAPGRGRIFGHCLSVSSTFTVKLEIPLAARQAGRTRPAGPDRLGRVARDSEEANAEETQIEPLPLASLRPGPSAAAKTRPLTCGDPDSDNAPGKENGGRPAAVRQPATRAGWYWIGEPPGPRACGPLAPGLRAEVELSASAA